MSGGHFNYEDSRLKNEIFGWTDKPANVFEDKEISELVWDVFDLIHVFDWYASGDSNEKKYLEVKAKFKAKWLRGDYEVRIREIVDDALSQCKEELYKTFDIKEGNDEAL